VDGANTALGSRWIKLYGALLEKEAKILFDGIVRNYDLVAFKIALEFCF
jgi:hypothetical protein